MYAISFHLITFQFLLQLHLLMFNIFFLILSVKFFQIRIYLINKVIFTLNYITVGIEVFKIKCPTIIEYLHTSTLMKQ